MYSRRFFLHLAVLSACLFMITGCGGSSKSSRGTPIIIISIDTLRSDHLPVYGYEGVATPALDAFRRDAVLFEHAYAHVPLTLPSHATMMTGLLPTGHGVRNNSGYTLPEQRVTLAERLREEGYRTGAVVSSLVMRKSVGLDQGFDSYDDDFGERQHAKIHDLAQRTGDASLAAARRWFAAKQAGPYFFFLHLYDPHLPYSPPAPYAQSYDGEIAFSDSLLGSFFDFLKQNGSYDEALIILTSDHGEGLGDHHEEEHGMFVYREVLQVPLLIKPPGQALGGTTVSQNVGLVDLWATTMVGAGLDPGPSDGVSLLPPRDIPSHRALYAESLLPRIHFDWFPQYSVIFQEKHLIRGYAEEFYDLHADPLELDNLFGATTVPRVMLNLLNELGPGENATAALTEEERAMLASLGYTGSLNPLNDARSIEPREIIEIKETISHCQFLINEGDYAAAERELLLLLRPYPGMRDARISLSTALKYQNKLEQTEYVLLEGLAIDPNDIYMLTFLAEAQIRLGKTEAGALVAGQAMERDIHFAGRNLLMPVFQGELYELAGEMASRLKAAGSDYPYASFVLGRVAAIKGEVATALIHLAEASTAFSSAEENELLAASLVFLAEAYAMAGRNQESLTSLRRALAAAPEIGRTRVLLAESLIARGRLEEAEEVLETVAVEATVPAASAGDGLRALLGVKLRLGKSEEALQLARRGLEQDSLAAAEPVCFGFLDFGSAETLARVAALIRKQTDGTPFPDFIRGCLAQREHDFEQALGWFRKSLEKRAGIQGPRLRNQTWFFMGNAAASLGRAQEAMGHFSEAVKAAPGAPEPRVAMATLYARLGRMEDAERVFRQWLRAFPSPHNLGVAVQTLTGLGMKDAAARLAARAP